MRNCDNCYCGSYGLDCNTGIETLYCCENKYEYEVDSSDVCESHQFIDGLGNERNYLLYDNSYLGEGYFIINEIEGKIVKFLKIYITNSNGFPDYNLRFFSVDGRDNPDCEFNSIEYVFRNMEDDELYNVFLKLSKDVDNKLETIDETIQGRNNVLLSSGSGIVKLVASKDVYRGKQHPSDFIDINLGDNYTCKNYVAVNLFYNSLAKLCTKTAKEHDIKKLIRLNVR